MQPVHVTNLTGGLRIEQGVPCADDIDLTTPVTGGRFELTPAEGVPTSGGGRYFVMTRANLTFAGFSVHRSCLGFDRTRTYSEIQVQIARAIPFTAAPTPTPGVYAITIPRSLVQVFYTTNVNGETESGTKIPRLDPTGLIDLNGATMSLTVVLATKVKFTAGCTPFGCVINETHEGTLTATVSGTLTFPDADGDGVPDRTDNCRLVANPDQTPVPTPTIAAPADLTVPSCLSTQFGAPTAYDVCDGGSLSISNNAPAVLDTGANTITWRAQDTSSRFATANQTVTVADVTKPVFTFVPPNVSLNNCSAADLGTPTAIDDCAGTPVLTNDAPPIFYVGTTPVTWTATDASGNLSTATQTVTVTDTVPPALTCTPENPPGNSYRISALDACLGAVTIRFGDYLLAEGEQIMINEVGRPGIRLVNNVKAGTVRHFHAGKGEAILTATDASGNTATVACPVK
jgi:hypothetical protein